MITRRNYVAKHNRNRGGAHLDRKKEYVPEVEDELDDMMYSNTCPHCGSENLEGESLMGALGSIEHHRCRYCGQNFERIAE